MSHFPPLEGVSEFFVQETEDRKLALVVGNGKAAALIPLQARAPQDKIGGQKIHILNPEDYEMLRARESNSSHDLDGYPVSVQPRLFRVGRTPLKEKYYLPGIHFLYTEMTKGSTCFIRFPNGALLQQLEKMRGEAGPLGISADPSIIFCVGPDRIDAEMTLASRSPRIMVISPLPQYNELHLTDIPGAPDLNCPAWVRKLGLEYLQMALETMGSSESGHLMTIPEGPEGFRFFRGGVVMLVMSRRALPEELEYDVWEKIGGKVIVLKDKLPV